MDDLARRYVTLALHIDRHFEGFVDAYFGPAELRQAADGGEPPSLDALAGEAAALAHDTGDVDDALRRDFLQRQARAMAAVIRALSGEGLGFVEEVQRYFDITPALVDEDLFEAAHAEIGRLLPGEGALLQRLAAWKQGLELPQDRIMPVLERARDEMRRRTRAFFDLPAGEELTLQLVQEQPWSGYNWYLGDYRSRVEINTDLPVRANAVVPLLAHEGYAGHHTEHAVKEQHLYRRQGRGEHTVQLLLAPECVLSEGIADSALDLLFSDAELAAFLSDELYPLATMPGVDVERQIRLGHAAEPLRSVSGNAALLLHRDGRPPDEVQAYLERWGLLTQREAGQTMKFLQNPLFRAYVFNYATGKTLLAPLLDGPAAVDNFWRLLSEPFTPSQVRAWIDSSRPT